MRVHHHTKSRSKSHNETSATHDQSRGHYLPDEDHPEGEDMVCNLWQWRSALSHQIQDPLHPRSLAITMSFLSQHGAHCTNVLPEFDCVLFPSFADLQACSGDETRRLSRAAYMHALVSTPAEHVVSL